VLVSLAILATACASGRGGPIPYSVADFGSPDAPKVIPLEEGYRIAPMDTLTIRVFKQADLSGDFEVDLAGNISMPLIGEVKATDLTTAELDQVLTDKFGAKYLEHPDVSVGIKSSTRRNLTVDGAVQRAGSFPVTGPTTLMEA